MLNSKQNVTESTAARVVDEICNTIKNDINYEYFSNAKIKNFFEVGFLFQFMKCNNGGENKENNFIKIINNMINDPVNNVFKDLHLKPTWKPSKGDINAIANVARDKIISLLNPSCIESDVNIDLRNGLNDSISMRIQEMGLPDLMENV